MRSLIQANQEPKQNNENVLILKKSAVTTWQRESQTEFEDELSY